MPERTDYFVIRNGHYTRKEIRRIEAHNERKKAHYTNCDVVPERSAMNVHFKGCETTYTQKLDELVQEGVVSTRGLRPDAVLIDEFMVDVNSAYFEEKGCYEYAKVFFEHVYRFCVEQAGGEEYILSAVMHADERNVALSEKLGYDVWHYHLHVVYIPVVVKEIKYSKRCTDKKLIGTVKGTIMQISHSKKWESKPLRDEDGKVLRDEKDNVLYDYSYSHLQTELSEYMHQHGYKEINRGIKGSQRKHEETAQFKLKQDQKRAAQAALEAEAAEAKAAQKFVELQDVEKQLEKCNQAVNDAWEDLSDIQDVKEYLNIAEKCKYLLQEILDRLQTFIDRSGLIRDKAKERSLFEDIRNRIEELVNRLRQLVGYEYRERLLPEEWKSTQIVEDMARPLDEQINSAAYIERNQEKGNRVAEREWEYSI